MLNYTKAPEKQLPWKGGFIDSFTSSTSQNNLDPVTVASFGEEWLKFNHFSEAEIRQVGNEYFDIVDETMLNNSSNALDVGCGSGRFSKYVCTRASFVEAIDPSNAVFAASELLKDCNNVRVIQADVSNIPFNDNSFDFVFSIGVLHHIPNTQDGITDCAKKVKIGGWLYLYLYYALDNRGTGYKILFQLSNLLRRVISKLPAGLKKAVCDIIALMVYAPFVGLTWLVKKIIPGNAYKKVPLSSYLGFNYKFMRNDALDRFGTPLEQRFSKAEIENMMGKAGITNIKFSPNTPYWHVVGQKIA